MAKGKNKDSGEARDFIKQIVIGVIIALLPVAITSAVLIPKSHAEIKGEIKEVGAAVSAQNSFLLQLQNNMNRELDRISGLQSTLVGASLNQKYSTSDVKTGLTSTSLLSDSIETTFNNKDYVKLVQRERIYENLRSTLALDSQTGQKYDSLDLSSKRFLVPYHNETKNEEVFFYGQFDANGYWDGNCIINVYKDRSLELIVEAEYSSGKMLYSQQVFHYTMPYSKDNQDVWAVSSRNAVYSSDGSIQYSSGYTTLYKRMSGYEQSFQTEKVTVSDILGVSRFCSLMNLDLYAYYSGNTSGGFFEDSTGDAYMIYFNDDYTVKTLYSGNFKEGAIDDDTGKAWWIVEDKPNENGCYGYYKGRFEKGNATEDYHIKYEYNISQERIDQILIESGRIFDYELKWRTSNGNRNQTAT